MSNRSWRRGPACAGLVVGLALLVAPAGAHAAAGAASGAASARGRYLGGYDIVPAGGVSSVGATFTLPKATCPASGTTEPLAFGDYVNTPEGDEFQPGGFTGASAAAILECTNGTASYDVFATAAGTPQAAVRVAHAASPTPTAKAGNVIEVSIAYTVTGNTVVTARDLSTGYDDSLTVPGAVTSVTQIYEGAVPQVGIGSGGDTIPGFGAITFRNSQVGGLPLRQSGPTATDLDQDGPVQVQTGPISSARPQSFTLTQLSTQ